MCAATCATTLRTVQPSQRVGCSHSSGANFGEQGRELVLLLPDQLRRRAVPTVATPSALVHCTRGYDQWSPTSIPGVRHSAERSSRPSLQSCRGLPRFAGWVLILTRKARHVSVDLRSVPECREILGKQIHGPGSGGFRTCLRTLPGRWAARHGWDTWSWDRPVCGQTERTTTRNRSPGPRPFQRVPSLAASARRPAISISSFEVLPRMLRQPPGTVGPALRSGRVEQWPRCPQ